MEFNLSRPGKPEKNRSDRKEKTGSTRSVTEDAGPVPAEIEEKKEEEDNKSREIEDERMLLMSQCKNIYIDIDEGEVKEREEIEEAIEKLKEAQGHDIATIHDVIEEVRLVLEKIEKKHESEIKIKNARESLTDWGEGIHDSTDKDEVEAEEWEEIEEAIEKLKEARDSDAAATQVKRINKELGKMQGFDDDTIQNKMNEVIPVLDSWGTEEKRKQEAEQSVRSDLRQIERMLVREESDSFENFRESLIEVKAVMEGDYVDGARKQLDLLQETEEYKVLLSRREEREQEEEVSKLLFGESRMVRDYILESQGKLLMPKEKFDLYFSSKDFDISADLKQQNVGDCYLIAAIHAMSRSPNFELFCRSSMERLHDGSWRVKIPLLSEDGEWITITQEEILPQENENFLDRRKDTGERDERRKLEPVQGKEGLQVLEAAYIKKRFSAVDRLAAEGGWGDEALMLFGGDNFVKLLFSSGDWVSEDWVSRPLNALDSEQANSLDSFLENFDPEIYMATVASGVTNNSSYLLYKGSVTGEPLVPDHTYSIAGVNAEEGTITLANPWNTSRPMEMSFDQFKERFSELNVVRIDNANLLLNMREVGRETGNIQ